MHDLSRRSSLSPWRWPARRQVRRRGPARLQRTSSALLESSTSPPGAPSQPASSRARAQGALCFSGGMTLPLSPPRPPPARALRQDAPEGDGWAYEPKWDGFRAIAFVDGDEVYLQSRNGKPLTRYFPELRFPAGRYVLDGEIVISTTPGRQDFDALGQRIHPAESRIDMLAEQTPARSSPSTCSPRRRAPARAAPHERRARLEQLVDDAGRPHAGGRTRRRAGVAARRRGRRRQGARRAVPPGRAPRDGQGQARAHDRRRGQGWRPGKAEGTVGSLILGLYDDDGELARSATRPASRPRRSASCRPAQALRDRRARQRRPEPLGERPRARVGRAAPRAGRRGDLRPHQRRPHPPRHEGRALARRQAAGRVPYGPAD